MDSAIYSSILIRWIVIYPVSSATQRWSQSSRGLSDKISRWQKKKKKKFLAAATKASKDQPRAQDDLNDRNVVVTSTSMWHYQSKMKLSLLGINYFFYFFLVKLLLDTLKYEL